MTIFAGLVSVKKQSTITHMSWFIYVSIKVGHANEFAYLGSVITIVRLEDEGRTY